MSAYSWNSWAEPRVSMACTWRQALAASVKKNKEPFDKWYQLATVRTNGRPANRTVVHRGFLNNTDKLLFITDARCSLSSGMPRLCIVYQQE